MSAQSDNGDVLTGQIRLDGGEQFEERPGLSIHALDTDGEVLARAEVNESGLFSLNEEAVNGARRIVITASQADPTASETASLTMRPQNFRQELEHTGEIAVSARQWVGLLPPVRHCIDATIQHCFPWWFAIDDLIDYIRTLPSTLSSMDVLPVLPTHRCTPVCDGVVEVYRRTCCCVGPGLLPNELPERSESPVGVEPPVEVAPRPVPEPFPEGPFPPPDPDPRPGPDPDPRPGPDPDPRPGPDPAPLAVQETLLSGGAIDVTKLDALKQDQFLSTGQTSQAAFGRTFCSCGPPVKVADGFVGDGGRIHVCWDERRQPPHPLPHQSICHDEYAFVVKQKIGVSTVTIYDGPQAGQWFDGDDNDIRLTSYHPSVIGCQDGGFPVPQQDAFVVLQEIGTTDSHHLRTPPPDAADSVQPPTAGNAGLLDQNGTDYALGGKLHLRYHFSEMSGGDMEAVGARYYRVQWAPADSNGNSAGPWETAAPPRWELGRYLVAQQRIERDHRSLGPHTVGGESDLFYIPFDDTKATLPSGNRLLDTNEYWMGAQDHAIVPTDSRPEGHYLIRLEVFDQNGKRLDPSTPGAGFTYQRWDTPTTTKQVPYPGLTHLVRTDNRPVEGKIHDVTGPGSAPGDCKFFDGPSSKNITFEYFAYHPETGTPSFMLNYRLVVRRGISGTRRHQKTSTTETSQTTVGSEHVSIGTLLGSKGKCSFAVDLDVRAQIHNGASRLHGLDRHDTGAFAVEQSSP